MPSTIFDSKLTSVNVSHVVDEYMKWDAAMFNVMLWYIHLYSLTTGNPVTISNIDNLIITSTIITYKFWTGDVYIRSMDYFAWMFKIPLDTAINLEKQFLAGINWNLYLESPITDLQLVAMNQTFKNIRNPHYRVSV